VKRMFAILRSRVYARLSSSDAAQIAEFAISVPLLVVFAVSIYDFGNAFGIKYKLVDAVREGARFAANTPTRDLTNPSAGGAPASVAVVPKIVGNYLTSAGLTDCGLAAATMATAQGALAWSYSVSGCSGPLTLTINRGATFTTSATTLYPQGQTVEATQVTLSYPYQWQFTNVIKLIAPGASYASSSNLVTSAVVQNLN